MNEYAPQHSRLFKEVRISSRFHLVVKLITVVQTIMVVTPNKPFVYTGKGSLQRQFILAEYAQEIEEMYQAIMEAAQEDIIVPTTWSEEEVTVFVRNAVHNVIKHDVSDSDDLFQHGCDRYVTRSSVIQALMTRFVQVYKLLGFGTPLPVHSSRLQRLWCRTTWCTSMHLSHD
jgi:hypothetical protein